jgi:formamidopyrimidine-DNA glycosylase
LPELPEVETVRRGLAPVLVDATIVHVDQRRADLRFPFPDAFAERLTGRRILSLQRRAKYLLATLDDETILVMHLGMSGSFRIVAADTTLSPGLFYHERGALARFPTRWTHLVDKTSRHNNMLEQIPFAEPVSTSAGFALGAHDHVIFSLSNGASVLYNDPRRFGFMLLVPARDLAAHPMFAQLGVEPLSSDFDGARLARLFAGRLTPLKAALLDQSLIAGLGNIYVCEALHRAGLSPRRAAGTLARRDGLPSVRALRLADDIRTVLLEAIDVGGSSLRDHRQTDGTLGYFQHRFRVYDRLGAPCPTPGCRGLIRRIVQNGRSTFFCATCQR